MMPPEYLAPGVYVEETRAGARVIDGAATSTTAFMGHVANGPVNEPVFIDGMSDFHERFGPVEPDDVVGISVRLFFENGGARACIMDVPPGESLAGDRKEGGGIHALSDGAISLKDFRKDMIAQLLNRQGSAVLSYRVYRCWVS